jgi:hypothetical protein
VVIAAALGDAPPFARHVACPRRARLHLGGYFIAIL